MTIEDWSKSSVEYGRQLLDSGVEGAISGEEAFLHGEPAGPFLRVSARKALCPAAVGASVALLGSLIRRRRSASGSAAAILFGGLIGFATGLLWESRHLTSSMATSAMKNISRARDEHWLERHPIDYA
jgi:hypothetical protein